MRRTRHQQPVITHVDAVGSGSSAVEQQTAPHIDDSQLLKPLTLTLGRPATLSVEVFGVPPPIVQWLVGRRRVKESARYQLSTEGARHTLMVSKVTDNMNLGVHVVAKNELGEDTCMIDVRTVDNNDEDNNNKNGDDDSESRPQQQQSNGDIVNKAEKINTAGEQVDDANSISRDDAGRQSASRRKRVSRVRGESSANNRLNMSLDSYPTQKERVNAMAADVSMSTDDAAATSSLNRSYDTATRPAAAAGRRTRSAAAAAGANSSSARRRRTARPGQTSSTSSVPSTVRTADDVEQNAHDTAAGQPVDDAQATAHTSGLLGRRRRRRERAEDATERGHTSLPAEQLQFSLVDQDDKMDDSFATPADSSSLLDVGSPRNTETVKTKKRSRKKPRGESAETLPHSGNSNAASTAAADQESEPDLSISKGFSPSFDMKTSSPVEMLQETQPVSYTATEKQKVSETISDANLWVLSDTRLNVLCKRLLADQNFDKSLAGDGGGYREATSKPDSMKRRPGDAGAPDAMDVDVNQLPRPTQRDTITELPLKVRSQENKEDTTVVPPPPISVILPTTDDRPVRRKPAKHKKQIEETPVEIPDETLDNHSRRDEDSRPAENNSSEFSTGHVDSDVTRDVPSTSHENEPRKPEIVVIPPSPGSADPAIRETAELEQAKAGEMPDDIRSPQPAVQTPDEEIQATDSDEDRVTAAEELERLKCEQRQMIEEEELRLEQEQKERLAEAEAEAERREKEIEEQEAERREIKRREKDERERRKREKKERKELEKREREMSADDLPASRKDESQHGEHSTKATPDSGYGKEIIDIKTDEPENMSPSSDDSQQKSSMAQTAPYDRYADIPMVDDVIDDTENIPPADHGGKEQTPVFEKSTGKKPPSGRKPPPRSSLFPAPVTPKPEDGQKDTLTYFRIVSPRTTLKEAKARDRSSSARQRSRSAERSTPPDRRGQSYRTGSHFTLVDIDIESEPADSLPASLSTSFDAGQSFSAISPIPSDFVLRRSLRPARSEEMLFVKKLSPRSPPPSNDSSLGSDSSGHWIRTAKSTDCLNRSLAGSEFSGAGLGRRSISREWNVVTTTTKEEVVFVKRPDEDSEERKRIRAEYEKNKKLRETKEDRLTKDREKFERERLERLLAELRRRRQKERQQLLEKKMAEKRAKEENDRFIRQAIEEQRRKRREEDKAKRESEQMKRDELNEKWRKDKEHREKLAKEKQEISESERQEKLEIERQFRLQMEEKKNQEQEQMARREKVLQEKREKEEKERRERELRERLEKERQQNEKEKFRSEQREREAKLLREKIEKERLESEETMEKKRMEKEREIMRKLEQEHKEKLAKLEEEKRLQQEQLEREKLKKEQEMLEKLAEEHKHKLKNLEEEARRLQEQLDREKREKEKAQRILREKMEQEKKEQEERKRREMEEKKRREKEQREAMEKVGLKHKIKPEKSEEESTFEQEYPEHKLKNLEEEARRLQEQLDREKREKEKAQRILREKIEQEKKEREERKHHEMEEKKRREEKERREAMALEHKIKPEKSEEESTFEQEYPHLVLLENVEKQQTEEDEIKPRELEGKKRLKEKQTESLEKLAEDNRLKLEQLERESLEREALQKIINDQKRRLDRLERDEKPRGEDLEKEAEERPKSTSQESKDDDDDVRLTEYVIVSTTTVQETVDVYYDQQSTTSLLSPSSPDRRRLPIEDTATQTDKAAAAAAAETVTEVRDYPVPVVTERLVSESEAPTSLPVPPRTASAVVSRPALTVPFRRRTKSTGHVDKDNVSQAVVHEYGELLSFWRSDTTGGRLTRARANSRREAAGSDDPQQATVRHLDFAAAERWTTSTLDTDEQPSDDREAQQSKSKSRQPPTEPVRHRDDRRHDDHRRPTSATDHQDIGDKSLVNNTISWIDHHPKH